MKIKHLFSIFFSFLLAIGIHAQSLEKTSSPPGRNGAAITELKGLVVDSADQAALPYASVYILHKNMGAISNENGYFSMDATGAGINDTLCVQYIGYETKKIILGSLDSFSVINLHEAIYNLNETLVFGNPPDPVFIVKQVLKKKEANYKKTTSVRLAFIRERSITDFDEFHLNFKNSTIPELGEKDLKLFEEMIPKHTTSYSDFLGNVFTTKNEADSAMVKVDPIRNVSLKEKDIEELEQYETIFKDLINTTDSNEYWKFRTGVLSQKMDTPDSIAESETDTVPDNKKLLHYFSKNINYKLSFSSLDDKDAWEFLHETGKYRYTLAGGTSFNGENVYIIDFTPRSSGNFTGRLYISVETFALIRADFDYAEGKTGRDIHLLGIGYTETQSGGSIYFEKKDDNYLLKYFSRNEGISVSINRNVEIAKKRKRALFDKELMDFDLELDITLRTENSTEFYVLDEREIPESEYESFVQEKYMDVIYVDRFDDDLWSGYSIIEPTKQMREYKKQK